MPPVLERPSMPPVLERSSTPPVLVLYEPGAAGKAALSAAERLAVERGTAMHVLVVLPLEREDVGCGRCRQSAALFNAELREVAVEWLAEAAGVLRDRRRLGGGPPVAFESARGSLDVEAIRVASREQAAEVVVPYRRRGPMRRLWPDWIDRLARAGPWVVRLGPRPRGRAWRAVDGA